MTRFIDLLKAAVRREAQWEDTRTPDWELDVVPHLDANHRPAQQEFLGTVPMPLRSAN